MPDASGDQSISPGSGHRGDESPLREPRDPIPLGVGPRGDPRGQSFPRAVGIGVCCWLLLSPIPFAGFLAAVGAGYLRRACPARDAVAGAATAVLGVSIAAVLSATVDPTTTLGLPFDVLHLGSVLVSALGTTALAVYLTVGYLGFVGAFGALLGVLGGYRGSGGYGASETAHQRAIALGKKYRGPIRGDIPASGSDEDDPGRERGESPARRDAGRRR